MVAIIKSLKTSCAWEEMWKDRPHSLLGSPAPRALPLSTHGMPSLLLGGEGKEVGCSILLLGPEAEITPSVTELLAGATASRSGTVAPHHFWLGPGPKIDWGSERLGRSTEMHRQAEIHVPCNQ